jgi:hypothetical protein
MSVIASRKAARRSRLNNIPHCLQVVFLETVFYLSWVATLPPVARKDEKWYSGLQKGHRFISTFCVSGNNLKDIVWTFLG